MLNKVSWWSLRQIYIWPKFEEFKNHLNDVTNRLAHKDDKLNVSTDKIYYFKRILNLNGLISSFKSSKIALVSPNNNNGYKTLNTIE